MKAENKALAQKLLRIKIDKMENQELTLGFALLMQYDVKEKNNEILIFSDNQWITYNPLENWQQLGDVLQTQAIVVGTHHRHDEKDKLTGYYYSCHGFFSGTQYEGSDYAITVARSCMALLEHNIKYPPEDANEVPILKNNGIKL